MRIPPLVASVLCAAASADAQNPVYGLPGEDGEPFSYLPIETGIEYADSARLGGSDRFLTGASLVFYSEIDRTGFLTFSLYRAVPANLSVSPGVEIGQPGVPDGALAMSEPAVDPLWTSGPTAVFFEGKGTTGLNLGEVIFSNINTLVPDDLFWSIQLDSLSDDEGSGFGPKLEDAGEVFPVGAGTDGSRYYTREFDRARGDWVPMWLDQAAPPTSTLSIELEAIPEPPIALISLIGLMALLRRRGVG